MRTRCLFATAPLFASLIVTACSSSNGSPSGANGQADAGDVGSGGSPRAAVTCAQIAAPGATFAPGWGSLPTALQQLPPGGTLCGVQTPGDLVVILTSYEGSQLLDFYTTYFTQAGCTTSSGAAAGSYIFTCANGTGSLNPASTEQIVNIQYTAQ
jgi:hypothetical protein